MQSVFLQLNWGIRDKMRFVNLFILYSRIINVVAYKNTFWIWCCVFFFLFSQCIAFYAGLENLSHRVRASSWARSRRKATVKIQKQRQLRILPMIQTQLLLLTSGTIVFPSNEQALNYRFGKDIFHCVFE